MTYIFDENVYRWAKANYQKVEWRDFATDRARLVFDDYHCIANPHLIRGSAEHIFWKEQFNSIFNCKCTYPFIVRLINSFMITGEKQHNLQSDMGLGD